MADPAFGYSQKTGRWWHVLESGKFIGYGHFVARATSGKVVTLFDVSRPKRNLGLTLLEGEDIVKPQKVVPGWDGEE